MPKQNTRIKSFIASKSKPQLILGALLVILAAYFLVYSPIAQAIEKREFKKAEKTLADLQGKIEAEIGPAEDVKSDRYCYYIQFKYDRGPRSCRVTLNMTYTVSDSVEATELAVSADKMIGPSGVYYKNLGGTMDAIQFLPYTEGDVLQKLTNIYYRSGPDFVCKTTYTYSLFDNESLIIVNPDSDSQKLLIYTQCNGSTKAEYYPVK